MTRVITLTILLLAFQFCFSQEFIGTWYMVNRSGLIKFSVSKDSIKTQELFKDFTPKGKPEESKKYIKTIPVNDRILFISESLTDSLKFSAKTFFNFNYKKYFQIAWNIRDTLTNDIESIIQIQTNDNRQLFGYFAFSEHYVDSLKLMRPIDSFSLSDFKKYLKVYRDKIKITMEDETKYNSAYLASSSHIFQLTTQSLYEIGFNPLQDKRTINRCFKKYYKDPEIKKIIEDIN